ncbi:hypothetical protein Tco_0704439 [Tanacetum coccineum]|uniref:Uncharacterized protein n=1 Tax=Tanacetum coccineum TaxID=301880 RepID=A0ABQ4Y3R0_9ASTR
MLQDTIKSKLEANVELTKGLQGESVTGKYFAIRMVEMINQKKKFYAEKKAKKQKTSEEVPVIAESASEPVVKDEEIEKPLKKRGKIKKQKARKGIHIDKTAQDCKTPYLRLGLEEVKVTANLWSHLLIFGFSFDHLHTKSSDREDDDEVSLNDDANDDAQDNDNQDDENQDDDDDEQTDSDNDGDDFVHPNDEEVQGTNTEEEDIIEEATHEDDEVNELYGDVNVNLEGRDTVMMDAPLPNVQATQETEDTYVILTASINPDGQQHSSSMSSNFVSNMLNPRPDTGIDSIFYTKANSLVDVPVTTIAEPPLVFATNLPPPPTPLITHMQQTLVPTPTTVSSSSLQHLPNFGSLFGFDHRLKTLETDFSEFKQTNQFAEVVSSIPGIVEAYLANKMHETIKTAVQLQSERLIDEAQAENPDFLNKLDDNINKIIKDQVKEQVKAQVSKILLKIEKLVND